MTVECVVVVVVVHKVKKVVEESDGIANAILCEAQCGGWL